MPTALRALASLAIAIVALAFVVATGVLGVGRGDGHFGSDDLFIAYGAGSVWAEGDDAYDEARLRDELLETVPTSASLADDADRADFPFANPPTAFPVLAGLSLAGFDAARVIYGIIGGVSALVIALVTWWGVRSASDEGTAKWAWLASVIAGAFAGASPFVSHNLWMGQSTLLVTALLMVAWWAWRTGRHMLCGVLCALASFKISLVVFFCLWLLLERNWRAVVAGLVAGLVITAPLLLRDGPIEVVRDWLANLAPYREHRTNQPEFRHSFGISSLLSGLGVRGAWTAGAGAFVAIAGFVWLWMVRERATRLEVFGICLSLALLGVTAHDYDLVALAPLAGAIALRCGGTLGAVIGLGALLAALSVPLRLVTDLNLPPVSRWREALVLGMTLFTLLAITRKPLLEARAREAATATSRRS